MRSQLRIVSGALRGRKVGYTIEPGVRPIPDRVREALFSILGNAVPERPFYDLFAGTGVIGLEALSRGASRVTFVERDPRVASEILRHVQAFGVADRATVQRADVYRWPDRWRPPAGPATLFLGPPFPDLERRVDDLLSVLAALQAKSPADSVLVLQSETSFDPAQLPAAETWENRTYGRNQLSFWIHETGFPDAKPGIAEEE